MRISIVNFSRRKIGGTEQNLDVVLPELERRGHAIQFVYVHDEPASREPVRTGDATELIHVDAVGEARALERVRDFRPDLINVHGEIDPGFQLDLLKIAPSAYSVHNYYGTCISGLKTHQFPVIQPCRRTFGPACLLQYFPRRCGGRSPITMLRRYGTERARLAVMSQYDAIITFSGHMEEEYLRHGLHPARVYGLPYEVEQSPRPRAGRAAGDPSLRANLLFAGRMERLKGGQVLLAAMPEAHEALRRPLELHFAGDGPERANWEALARETMRRCPEVDIHFHGWVTGAELHELFRRTHLMVVPSLWPEPFGKVGPEAGAYGIPVAAFDVGGVSEWLSSGKNGLAAPGNPPTAPGLAHAIAGCVRDRETHARLAEGAAQMVTRFDPQSHVDRLLELFARIASAKAAGAAA